MKRSDQTDVMVGIPVTTELGQKQNLPDCRKKSPKGYKRALLRFFKCTRESSWDFELFLGIAQPVLQTPHLSLVAVDENMLFFL